MVAHFRTRLSVTPLDNEGRWWQFWIHRRRWYINEPLVYYSALLRLVITVPKGEITNFASVPRIPFVFTLAGDTAHRAATLHDYLCRLCGILTVKETLVRLTPRQVDAVFFESLSAPDPDGLTDDEPRWRQWLLWLGVRAFVWARPC